MEKIITFIIVTWNNEDVIIDCLNSIFKYCNNFKIMVIDNNSSDSTTKVIKQKNYSNCEVFELKNNIGFAKGNNYVLNQIDTPYLCYLNPDTILLEDIVKPSINILKNNPNIGIVGSKLLYKNMKLQASTFNYINARQVYYEAFRIGKLFPNFIKEKFFPNNSKSKKNKYVDWIIGAEMIMKTEDAKSINGFSEEYYMYVEDMDICRKMLEQMRKKTFYDSKHCLIHIGGTSEAKNVNYNKLELLIKNKVLFSYKFNGTKEASKTCKALYYSYRIRLIMVYLFYWTNKEKRNYYIKKMKTGKDISKELSLKYK